MPRLGFSCRLIGVRLVCPAGQDIGRAMSVGEATVVTKLEERYGGLLVAQMRSVWQNHALPQANKPMMEYFLSLREKSPQPPDVPAHEDATEEHMFEMIAKMVLIAPVEWYQIASGLDLPAEARNDFSCIGVAFDASSRLRRAGIEWYHKKAFLMKQLTRPPTSDRLPDVPCAIYVSQGGQGSAPQGRAWPVHGLPPKLAGTARVVMVSDTHLLHRYMNVPDGDVLVHAGDVSYEESRSLDGKRFDYFLARGQTMNSPELRKWLVNETGLGDALTWLKSLPFRHKVLVGGNHDYILERLGVEAGKLCRTEFGLHYLDTKDAPCSLEFAHGFVTVWGSPVSAIAGLDKTRAVASGNSSFQVDVNDGPTFLAGCPALPQGSVDIMVTHTPPEGMLLGKKGKTLSAINELIERARPQLYVCGHAHNGDDLFSERWAAIPNEASNGIGVNAACLATWNYLHGMPVVVDIKVRPRPASTEEERKGVASAKAKAKSGATANPQAKGSAKAKAHAAVKSKAKGKAKAKAKVKAKAKSNKRINPVLKTIRGLKR